MKLFKTKDKYMVTAQMLVYWGITFYLIVGMPIESLLDVALTLSFITAWSAVNITVIVFYLAMLKAKLEDL